jgi:hypothetical protein
MIYRKNVKPRVASAVSSDPGLRLAVTHGKNGDRVSITGMSLGPRGFYDKVELHLKGAAHMNNVNTYGAGFNPYHYKNATSAVDVAQRLADSIIVNNPNRVYAEVQSLTSQPDKAQLVIRWWSANDQVPPVL